MPDPSSPASISVAVVSKGRPEILAATLESLTHQTHRPAKIVVVVPSPSDLPAHPVGEVQTVVGPLGASLQRNEAIKVIPLSVGYVAFIDDDMEFAPDYLESAVAFMERNPGVVGCSGHVLGNGNVSRDEAARLIAGYQPVRDFKGMFSSSGRNHTLHGCNMIIRRGVLEYEQFDEQLPLYSYNEDYDLSLRLEAYGKVGRFSGCIAVHLEAPSGRVREDLRGYSLVANNYYFITQKKVHLPRPVAWLRFWLVCVIQTLLSSIYHILKKDRAIDDRGRIRGICLAVQDIFAGKSHPGRIKDL